MPAYSTELHSAIIAKIKEGNFAYVAARVCGVSRNQWGSWVRAGKAGKQPFAQLLADSKQAESFAEAANLAIITSSAQKSWQAAAWYLERKLPNRWGRRERVDMRTTDYSKLSKEEKREELRRVHEELQKELEKLQ